MDATDTFGKLLPFRCPTSFVTFMGRLYYRGGFDRLRGIGMYLIFTVGAGMSAVFAAVQSVAAENGMTSLAFSRRALSGAVVAVTIVAAVAIVASGFAFGGSAFNSLSRGTLTQVGFFAFGIIADYHDAVLLSFGVALVLLLASQFAAHDGRGAAWTR